MAMRALVVTEYYPQVADPVRGIWVHRQTLAAKDAGADVRVLVLHRPLPSLAALGSREAAAISRSLRLPRRGELDGVPIEFLNYVSPPRPWSYASWGAWAAPMLAVRLRRLRRTFPYDLIHAHYAVPAGDAVRRALPKVPMLVSVHGHDVYGDLAGDRVVKAALAHAGLVLANSAETARRSEANGARHTQVVHLGADVPDDPSPALSAERPSLVTVAHLASRKRHRDVIDALSLLHCKRPDLRYVIVGDGPERPRLAQQASELGLSERIEFAGALPHRQAQASAASATLFVMPSVDEAFGVAYIEAMAGEVPAIGSRGESGPEEIAAAGGGIELVAPRSPEALAAKIDELLSDQERLKALGRIARETVQQEFTWPHCGRRTLAAYEALLATTAAPGRPKEPRDGA
ncbi:MAG: glycosyltransferase [Solirubrobacterales bacterium]|nr:glycosyltransferase [Solirubrobacterales bacterium]